MIRDQKDKAQAHRQIRNDMECVVNKLYDLAKYQGTSEEDLEIMAKAQALYDWAIDKIKTDQEVK